MKEKMRKQINGRRKEEIQKCKKRGINKTNLNRPKHFNFPHKNPKFGKKPQLGDMERMRVEFCLKAARSSAECCLASSSIWFWSRTRFSCSICNKRCHFLPWLCAKLVNSVQAWWYVSKFAGLKNEKLREMHFWLNFPKNTNNLYKLDKFGIFS